MITEQSLIQKYALSIIPAVIDERKLGGTLPQLDAVLGWLNNNRLLTDEMLMLVLNCEYNAAALMNPFGRLLTMDQLTKEHLALILTSNSPPLSTLGALVILLNEGCCSLHAMKTIRESYRASEAAKGIVQLKKYGLQNEFLIAHLLKSRYYSLSSVALAFKILSEKGLLFIPNASGAVALSECAQHVIESSDPRNLAEAYSLTHLNPAILPYKDLLLLGKEKHFNPKELALELVELQKLGVLAQYQHKIIDSRLPQRMTYLLLLLAQHHVQLPGNCVDMEILFFDGKRELETLEKYHLLNQSNVNKLFSPEKRDAFKSPLKVFVLLENLPYFQTAEGQNILTTCVHLPSTFHFLAGLRNSNLLNPHNVTRLLLPEHALLFSDLLKVKMDKIALMKLTENSLSALLACVKQADPSKAVQGWIDAQESQYRAARLGNPPCSPLINRGLFWTPNRGTLPVPPPLSSSSSRSSSSSASSASSVSSSASLLFVPTGQRVIGQPGAASSSVGSLLQTPNGAMAGRPPLHSVSSVYNKFRAKSGSELAGCAGRKEKRLREEGAIDPLMILASTASQMRDADNQKNGSNPEQVRRFK